MRWMSVGAALTIFDWGIRGEASASPWSSARLCLSPPNKTRKGMQARVTQALTCTGTQALAHTPPTDRCTRIETVIVCGYLATMLCSCISEPLGFRHHNIYDIDIDVYFMFASICYLNVAVASQAYPPSISLPKPTHLRSIVCFPSIRATRLIWADCILSYANHVESLELAT